MTIIQTIKQKVRIEDVIGADVKLKQSGASYSGLCPFHDNKNTPSFVVYPNDGHDGRWKCFGSCNESGDVISYIEKRDNVDTREACRILAEQFNIEIAPAKVSLNERMAAATDEEVRRVAMGVFRKWLVGETDRKTKAVIREGNKAALAYAMNDRAWTMKTLQHEWVGFSGNNTQAERKEMTEEFKMYGIDPLSPAAVMIMGLEGNVAEWAVAHGFSADAFGETKITGFMDTPALVYAHRFSGEVLYLSARFLPEWEEKRGRKSHNPNSILAGAKRTYRNSLYRERFSEDQPRGAMLYVVEGQGDSITNYQFGVPGVALCGAEWRRLVDNGEVADWHRDYEQIIFIKDLDTAGHQVVAGKEHDFQMARALGELMWVGEPASKTWKRADGREKSIKDINDMAVYLQDTQSGDKKQDDAASNTLFNSIAMQAERIVVLAAKYAGKMSGHPKNAMVEKVLKPMIMAIPETERVSLQRDIAIALFPDLAKSAATTEFGKWLKAQVKAAENAEGNDGELPKVETLGGWYPDETRKSGYLVDVFFDRAKEKLVLAWAHIKNIETGEREIGHGPYLELHNKKLMPPQFDENIFDGAVKVPSALGEKMSSWDLVKKNAEFYRKYFYMEDKSRYTFFGAWSLATWAFDCFDQVVHLHARGGSGSGKSDLMYLVGVTSYRFAVTLAMSSTASYKGLRKLYQCVVMIDEVENIMKKDDGTMAAFLKGSAMKRYSRVMNAMEVMTPNGKVFVPTSTNVYGPVLLTGYKPFADDGIENRCMKFDLSQVDMFTLAKNKMAPGYYPPELEAEAENLRNLALRWRLETWLPSIELSKEQMEKHNDDLMDPHVSARVNQVLRPMKVLAILQNDDNMLEDLKKMGRANYEDEMIKRAGSFEALVLRGVLAADIAADAALQEKDAAVKPQASADYIKKVKGYADLVKVGKLKSFGHQVRYILYMNLAKIVNELFDLENLTNDVSEEEKKKRKKTQSKTAGDICREVFRLPVVRTGSGFVVVLDRERLDIAKLRFGLNLENDYDPNFKEQEIEPVDEGKPAEEKKPAQATFQYVPSEHAVWLDRADEEENEHE